MNTGRFIPLAAVTTALVSSTVLLLAPACGDDGAAQDCGEECAPVEGAYPLAFRGDAGLPPECVNLNVPALPEGKDLRLMRDGGTLTGSLEGVALRGQVSATGDLSLTGAPLPSADGGLTTFLSLTASFTGGPADGGGDGSLSGIFTGNFSRLNGGTSQRCFVTRPFTATRR
ncbi:hypothetical protein [Corallococcus llansteffanensis]|uniref:Lipoprotein n=1 Tax=Corallococcus llansteffanensis TaxID=2316731 RepID=A0A3A8N506_9BACT|nr:hypothetical protein [Corallococcus llansteffanensis]RKH34334.1 hypothetical protein D7V93_43620 [Corallococcus llansteffanensis]